MSNLSTCQYYREKTMSCITALNGGIQVITSRGNVLFERVAGHLITREIDGKPFRIRMYDSYSDKNKF